MSSEKPYIRKKLPSGLIPKTDQTWLLQPVAATWMRYDYSLLQSKIFMSIIAKLQFAIKEAIVYKRENKYPSLSLFSDEQYKDFEDSTSILLKIPISEFGLNSNQYIQLKEALKQLATIPIESPYKDSKGRNYTIISGLCEAIIPESKRVNEIIFKIKRTTAERMLNMDFGYHKFLQVTTATAKNSYTPRLYLLLSVKKDQGIYKISMSDLRKYLRLQNKYGRYCEFKKRVLTPVQEELKEKSATNSSDFSFDYTEEYAPGVRRTGEPLYLNFKINVSSTFVDNHEQELLKSQQRYIYDILRSKSLLLQEEKASEISSMVTLENYQRISMRIQSVNEKFMEKNDIKDKRSYLYKSLINEIEEKDDPVDE